MKKALLLVAVGMLLWRVAPAQIVESTTSSSPNGTLTEIASHNGDGFKAEYYNGANFEEKVLTRTEKKIGFYLINQSPAKEVDFERFSVRWTGKLYVPKTGTYAFMFVADDGVRMWIDNKLVVDEWHLNPPTKFTGKMALTGNQVYDLRFDYSQMMPQHAVAKVSWRIDDGPEMPIDTRYVYSAASKIPPVTARVSPKQAPPKVPPKTTLPKKVVRQPAAKPSAPVKIATAPNVKKKAPVKPVKKAPAPALIEKKETVSAETFDYLTVGKSIVLNNIFFDQSQHALRPESHAELNKLVNTLRKYPQLKITVTGHTDNVGDFDLNVQLSRNRAKAVTDYLVAHGIAQERLEHAGFGSLYPVAPNTTEENKMKNRRVEFAVR